jgi:anthranilate phosphoribosyltransferase
MSVSTRLQSAIKKLVTRTELSSDEISDALDGILSGATPDSSIAAFLVALAMKGETADELRSVLLSLRRHAVKITPSVNGRLVDICGTGGDFIKSFNISSAAAIVASAASAKVAKHGNRSVSGVCGSADFFEYIGLDLNSSPARVQSCIERIGIGFLFAPVFHPSMKNVASVRRIIGVHTVFNKVGPLSNPCTNISGQVIGVFELPLLKVFSEVCKGYIREAMIVHAYDGLDELSNTCENDIYRVLSEKDTIKKMHLRPEALGMNMAKPEQIAVSTREDSVKFTLQTIYGKANREKQDIVILNAAAALVVANIALNFKEGIEIASEAIKSGKAHNKLSQMIKYCGDLEKLKEVEKFFSLI